MENDIESVALGTLLTGMRKLYWETEQYMRSRIEEVEHRYRQLVGAAKVVARHEVDDEQPVFKQRGRPRNSSRFVKAGHAGWSSDPVERSREMKRRQKKAALNRQARESGRLTVREARKTKPSHPRDAGHPNHDEWLEKVKSAATRRWEEMTPAKQKKRLAAMLAGRKQKTNGHLEAQ